MNDPIVIWVMLAAMVILAVVSHFMHRAFGPEQREKAYCRVMVENKNYFPNRRNR